MLAVYLALTAIGIWILIRWARRRDARSGPEWLAALPDDADDPLVATARCRVEESRRALPELFHERPNDTYVRFPVETSSGKVEQLWGQLRAIRDDHLHVIVITPPETHTGRFYRERQISLEDVTDWQVTLPDGRIRGGFLKCAKLHIYQREHGTLPKPLAVFAHRLVDAQFDE